MKKILFALSAFLFVACNTGSPYSAEPLSSAGEVISSDMSSVSLPSSSSECACSVEVESSSSTPSLSFRNSSSSSLEIWDREDWFSSSSSFANSILWEERGVEIVVEKYAGDTLESICGRFWVFKETPLSSKEISLLEKRGISIYDRGSYYDHGKSWNLILLKSDSSISKKTLNEDLASFYNAIPVNDTSFLPIEWNVYWGDSTALDMSIDCWPDINVLTCMDIVEKCGVSEDLVFYAYQTVYVFPFDYPASTSVCDCLSKNRDVRVIWLSPGEGLPS